MVESNEERTEPYSVWQCPPPSAAGGRGEGRAPPLGLDARRVGGQVPGGGVGAVAQHLPADGRVGVEQPVDHAHQCSLIRRCFLRTTSPPRAPTITTAPTTQ